MSTQKLLDTHGIVLEAISQDLLQMQILGYICLADDNGDSILGR